MDYAPTNRFLSFTTATIDIVGQDFLPYEPCKNMNLRKMVDKWNLHTLCYVCAKNGNFIETVKRPGRGCS